MKTIELINLLGIIEGSIVAMDSEYKRQRFNIILSKIEEKPLQGDSIDNIIKKTGEYYGLPEDYHETDSQKRAFVYARQQAMMIIYELFPRKSLEYIGSCFGGRDHATVLHAKKTVKNNCDTDKKYKKEYKDLRKKFGLNL
jgi:chromosomal replication initiator protein